jgi:hypothetical protein
MFNLSKSVFILVIALSNFSTFLYAKNMKLTSDEQKKDDNLLSIISKRDDIPAIKKLIQNYLYLANFIKDNNFDNSLINKKKTIRKCNILGDRILKFMNKSEKNKEIVSDLFNQIKLEVEQKDQHSEQNKKKVKSASDSINSITGFWG